MALAIDLYCGLGGWTDGLLAEGWDVIGFDNEQHEYGEHRYPGKLVLQNVLTLHGSQFRDAALIVASPPCTEYSYMAMPWKRAKQIARALRGEDSFPDGYTGSRTVTELNRLFDACFRIQREACEAAGKHIPLIVENVRGAQPWVGSAQWAYGSYYLWGDVPVLMPIVTKRPSKVPGLADGCFPPGGLAEGAFKSHGMNWSDGAKRGQDFTRIAGDQAFKNAGFRFDGSGRSFQSESVARKIPSEDGGRRTDVGKGARFTSRDCGMEGRKNGNDWFGSGEDCSLQRRYGSRSSKRKMASAMIAKIPFALSSHIARVYKP